MTPTCPRCGDGREADSPCPTCGFDGEQPRSAVDEALIERVDLTLERRSRLSRANGRRGGADQTPLELPPALADRLRRQAVLLRDELAAHERARTRIASALAKVEQALAASAVSRNERAQPLLDVKLPRIQNCSELARRQIHKHADALLEPRTAADAALIASELVNNAYLHGSGAISMRAFTIGDRLRIEVSDEGHPTWIGVRATVDGGTGGWGLWIVDRLSLDWGTDEESAQIWAELPLGA